MNGNDAPAALAAHDHCRHLAQVLDARGLSARFASAEPTWLGDTFDSWTSMPGSPDGVSSTNVWCWRRPGRKRCRGEIIAERQRGSPEIWWHCPLCGVNGVIRGWEGSLWGRRRGPE